MSVKADRIVKALFGAFMEDSQILPPEYQQKSREREQAAGVAGRARVVADYIAGMTDRYAIGEYERLFDPSRLT
jgi:dGTPase